MLKDSSELEITTDSHLTVAAINEFTDELLSVGNNTQVIKQAVEADSNCVIGNTLVAAFHLFSGQSDALTAAAPYINNASLNLRHANKREQLYVAAIEAWAKRDIKNAIAYHETIAEHYPRDLASVHIAQYHYRNIGDSQGLLRIAEKVSEANLDNSYIYGMLAFGLEECHRLEEAEIAGRKAVDMKHDNRWAQHAVAHVLETQGRLDEGIAWMESVWDTWESSNPAFYNHLWWHTALYHLDADDIHKVLEIYDTQIWGRARKDNGREQINAISLLLRLQLRGIDVSARWQEIADYLYPRLHEHLIPFLDLQYIYALVQGGRNDWAVEMLDSIKNYADKAQPYAQKTWRNIALPAAYGMIAHAQGNWLDSINQLEPVLPKLYSTGGSHAQRDLFEQIYLDALIHVNEHEKALSLLSKRNTVRSNIPITQRQLAHVNSKLNAG